MLRLTCLSNTWVNTVELKSTGIILTNPSPVEPFAKSADPDQLASEANWSGSALFAIKYVNLYQQPGSSNMIGWKLEVGVAIYSAWQGLTACQHGSPIIYWVKSFWSYLKIQLPIIYIFYCSRLPELIAPDKREYLGPVV